MAGRIISTIPAKCRDCYKCLRSCPVKAIQVKRQESGGELYAQVMDERCIVCGRCVQVCPQKAKRVTTDVEKVRSLLQGGLKVVASVAPSFAGALPVDVAGLLPAALRRLGFSIVQETALGAEMVGAAHRTLETATNGRFERPLLSTSCPAIVNLVEKHFPHLLPHLAPVVSPMVAHARYLRQQYPEAQIVFVGPCFAKKEEVLQINEDEPGLIAAALTFQEIWEWWQETQSTSMTSLVPEPFDPPFPRRAQLFPIEGGLLYTAEMTTGPMASDAIVITGVDHCVDFLTRFDEYAGRPESPRLIEMLSCSTGCIAGPGAVSEEDPFLRRNRVIQHHRQSQAKLAGENTLDLSRVKVNLERRYKSRAVPLPVPDEAAIKAILARTGKLVPEDELNCGACGYGSCREKAIAVYQGLAEIEMCMPFMRAQAESFSDIITRSSPNAIIIVNDSLRIININPAAEKMFRCEAARIIGRHLSRLIDPAHFQSVLAKRGVIRTVVAYPQYDLVTDQSIFYVEKQNVVVGFFIDITEEQKRHEEIKQLKMTTAARAQEVIQKQMQVAQEIASLLGETTAETKVLLSKLVHLMQEEN